MRSRGTRGTDTQAGAYRGAPALRLERDLPFKPEDSLLIDIEFKKDKPPRIETPVAGQPPITIPGEPAPVLAPDEQSELQRLIDLVRSKNPYQLDSSGALQLPGFAPIMIAGLDEQQATHRLASMRSFARVSAASTLGASTTIIAGSPARAPASAERHRVRPS